MPRNPVLTLRIPEYVFHALDQERHLRHLNVSRWARAAVLEAFHRDFPYAAPHTTQPASPGASTEDPQGDSTAQEPPPLLGWNACQLPQGGGLGCRHDDPASLPDELFGLQIEVKTKSGQRLLRWVHAVVERTDDHVYVRDGLEKP